MTQRELAAQLNKNEAEISRWFCLKNGIGKTNLIRINEILGIDAEKGTQKYQQKKSIKSTKNKNNMNYAIILAGGIGSRVGANVPKQFVEILGKPVLAYTIEAYQNHPEIDGIEVVCVKNYEKTLRDLITKYNLTKVKWICQGGATFQDSVFNGVENLKGEINENDIVMVHYGAAPFTSDAIITDAIKVCQEHGCSVSVTPCFQLMGTNDANGERKKLLRLMKMQM